MQADLKRLVAVRKSYALSRLAPPAVREAFAEIVAAQSIETGVELRIEEQMIEGQPWMVARVLRVPDGLVDHTTLQCNVENSARTVSRTSQGTSTSIKLPQSGVHNGCAATARTRQGGVLFSATLAGQRVLLSPGSSNRFRMPEHRGGDREAGVHKKKKWPWIVAISAAVVAGGVTAGVLLSQRSNGSDQQAGAVTVNW
jgi:hypothetical protein